MAKTMTGEAEERMWCGHCGVNTPIRREGNSGTVMACNWCGKILADETGTAEEYNQLFLQYLALQDSVSISSKRNGRRNKRRKKIKTIMKPIGL